MERDRGSGDRPESANRFAIFLHRFVPRDSLRGINKRFVDIESRYHRLANSFHAVSTWTSSFRATTLCCRDSFEDSEAGGRSDPADEIVA